MKLWNRLISFSLAAALLLSVGIVPALAYEPPTDEAAMASALKGTWEGNFYVVLSEKTYTNDKATINFLNDEGGQRMYLAVQSCESNYVSLNNWQISEDILLDAPEAYIVNELDDEKLPAPYEAYDGYVLAFSFNQKPWKAEVRLHFEDAKTLKGTYTQYGKSYELTMKKTSSTPVDMGAKAQYEYESEGTSYSEWSSKLSAYQTYSKDATVIPFTYELNNKSKLKSVVQQYGLDDLMASKTTDIDKMIAMLNFVSDHYPHNGASGMPEKQDVNSVIRHCEEQGGVECRGLSIILSDLLRAYGIPAKSIKCAPADIYSEYCHVVVHAYSKSLNQWVMLDPTYRLVLKDENGQYISLPMLRQSLISGAKLIPNTNAGRNLRPFYMDFYRAYMTKNSFHFSSATNFAYGTDSTAGNAVYTLTPVGYSYSYAYSRGERPTTSSESFWQAPAV